MFRPTSQVVHAGEITCLDGTFIRFGPDERDVFNVPLSITFDTEMPGGFGPANIVLPRPQTFDKLRARLFSGVRLYDARSNDTIYEGRITGTPSDSESVTLECEGWIKALEDDKTARFLGIDRDQSNWQGMTNNRKLDRLAVPQHIEDANVDWDSSAGSPAVTTSLSDPWSDLVGLSEGWYWARGLPIGGIDYAWRKSATVDSASVNWTWTVVLSSDDLATTTDSSGNLKAAGPSSGTVTATDATNRKWAAVRMIYGAALTATSGKVYKIAYTLAAPFGDHGLTLQGTLATPNTGRGLLVSDMVAYLVGSYAVGLNYTTGTQGSIGATSFAVPHAAWLDDTTALDIISQLAPFGGNDLYALDYYVYDNRMFYLQGPTQHGQTWWVRKDEASQEESQGPDASRRLNGVKVRYDDGSGNTLSVGPPGSQSDFETTDLQDVDPNNPATMDGLHHYDVFDAGITSTDGAILVGQMILRERNTEEWRGTITLTGEVQNDAGVWLPAAKVRAGDWIVVEDDVEDTAPRRVVQTSYENQAVSASVGALPDHLDTLLARAGVVLTGRI